MLRTFTETKVSNNIKIIRLNSNKSVYQVAKETGIAQSFLTDIENQKKTPSLKMIDKLANYYNIEVYEFFL